ncbi:MAG: response regulator transcription factor, partial [Rhodoferax sp.]|nr:response regulator transcription factor [Actinomycetota bacterium]
PALGLLGHTVRVAPLEVSALLGASERGGPQHDAVLVDARRDPAGARSLCRLLRTTGVTVPLFAVLTEGGLVALTPEWGLDDVLLDSAGPAEVDARLRLATGKAAAAATSPAGEPGVVRAGDLTIDEGTYTCRLRGRVLDLTFKEFELLKYLAQHPGRVFTRAQLLQEVWGYDYYGGTRTVDVHVRRLRAKLGAEHEQLIGTVRHVGYKFVTPPIQALTEDEATRTVSV